MRRFTVLCGGLGGSRFVDSLARAAGPETVTAVGNVGDDVEILGLHVSPDLDTVLYTLAGLLDEERGWGVRDETYSALDQVRALGGETWFTLGDRDIGLHLVRTEALRAGLPLSATFARLAEALGVGVLLLPVTDDPLRTRLTTADGELDFQTWFVRRRHADAVLAVAYDGAEAARPAPGVLEAIDGAERRVRRAVQPVRLDPADPRGARRGRGRPPARARRRDLAARRRAGAARAARGDARLARARGERGRRGAALRRARGLLRARSARMPDEAPAIEALGLRAIVAPIVMADPATRESVGRAILEAL